MRGTLVVLLLLMVAAGCRTRIATEGRRELYGGVGIAGLPDVGGAVTAGQYFSTKESPRFDYAFEMRGLVQGGDDSASQNGRFFGVQMGVRQVASPGHRSHLFFRYGVTWFRANGDPRILDGPGDYFGAYGAVGWEWELGGGWTIGPEAGVSLVNGEGSIGNDALPQVALNLLFNF